MTHPKPPAVHRLAILLLAATPALAQPASPTLKVNTRLTRVDITATDSNGHPIHGLTQSDFTIKEDGKPQPIKNFEESSTAQPALPEPPPHLPPNVYTNAHAQHPVTGTAIQVLLIDDVSTGLAQHVHITAASVSYERDQAIQYVKTMPPGTPVILMEMTSRLRVLQPLTTDRDVLLAALRPIAYKQNARTSLGGNGLPIPGLLDPPQSVKLPMIGQLPPPPEGFKNIDQCEALNEQSEAVINNLDNAAAYLSRIKGRKNLIWFTPGLPWMTNLGAYDRTVCLRDYSAGLQRDYNLLAAAQVALYPINPRGASDCLDILDRICQAVKHDDHASMEDFADATGGHAFYNTNDLAGAIRQAVTAGSNFYSVFYIPPRAKYDGQYHQIKVTVDRPGIHLEYRKGYTSIDPAKAPRHPPAPIEEPSTPPSPDSALYTAMAHGAAPSTEIVFTVAITPADPPIHPGDPIAGQLNPTLKLKGNHLTRYDFNYTLAPDQITFTDDPEHKRQSSIEFTVAAYDGTGATLNVIRQTASLTLPPSQLAAFLKRNIPMHLQLDLPPGPIFLRAAIRDIPSNKLGTLEIPLTVPK